MSGSLARSHNIRDCIARLTRLNEAAIGFAELAPDADIYRFIAETLHRFVPDSIVLVSSCDDNAAKICARSVVGLDPHMDAALSIIGRKLEGMTVPLTDETRTLMSCGRLVELPDGLRKVAGRAVSDRAVEALRRILRPSHIYAMGFHWKDHIHGAAAVMLRRGTEPNGIDVLETFMRLAAVALQRHRAERELTHIWTTAKPTRPREHEVHATDGEHWVLSAMFPVLADGAVTEVFRIDVDISVRRQAEQELARHRAHLEELVKERACALKYAHEELLRRERLAALGRLAGTVAHEIRNPLGAIRNAVYYPNITAARRFEGHEARHLEIIQE